MVLSLLPLDFGHFDYTLPFVNFRRYMGAHFGG